MQIPIPTLTDLFTLLIAYFWVIAIIGFSELLRRLLELSASITRKFVHLFAGFAIFTVPFYSQAWFALLVSLPLLILIFLASPKSPIRSLRTMFEVMAREEDYLSGHIWGPFLYAISINVLVFVFTLIPSLTPFFVLPAIGLTAMFLGDGLAPFIGSKFGKHKYRISNTTRTIEGSIVVFFGSVLGSLVCYFFFEWFAKGGAALFSLWHLGILTVVCGITATIIEAVSPAGSDNLTVPLLTTLILVAAAIVIFPPMLAMITS
jgi:phytol kinase